MMINFITPYKNDYTVPYEPENKNEFKTKYINREIDTVISGKDRPKDYRFKSRLISK